MIRADERRSPVASWPRCGELLFELADPLVRPLPCALGALSCASFGDARDRALDEVVLQPIPDAEPLSRGSFDMERHELANAERVIAPELLLECPALRRVAWAQDLERDVGRSFLPYEVRVEGLTADR